MRRQIALLGMVIVLLAVGACSPDQASAPANTTAPTARPATVAPTAVPSPTRLPTETPGPPQIELTSPAFESGAMIPARYTRKGGNISPPLAWSDPPQGTASLALVVFSDPLVQGSGGRWVQWLLYNIPPETRGLPEGVVPDADGRLPDGSRHLPNSWGELAYGGPNPEKFSTPRYYFQIYALDAMLDLGEEPAGDDGEDPWIGATRESLLRAMEGHVLAQGELVVKCKGQ